MAVTIFTSSPFVAAAPTRSRCSAARRCAVSCRTESSKREQVPLLQKGQAASYQLAAAGLAAAVLLHASAADAGVILEKVVSKKVFQSDGSAPAKAAPATTSSSFKAPSFSAPSISLPVGLLAIPAAVGAIAGGGLLLSKVDEGFGDFMEASIVKDSRAYAGYEEALRSSNGVVAKAKSKVASTVKKTAKAAKKTTGISFPNPFAK